MQSETHRGGCLCGAVRFEADAPLRDVVACHCTQCRKASGHVWAATSVPLERFRLTEQAGLVWYRSSPAAQRGHCGRCGATLFWLPEGEGRMSLSPGALDGPTGIAMDAHIYTGDGSDYDPESTAPAAAATTPLTANCLCGDCCFSLPGPAGAITACHCRACRKLSGHFAASLAVAEADLAWQRRESLAEYDLPSGGQHGFCARCGSSLYQRAEGGFAVAAGAINGATGGHLAAHLGLDEKGDYYDLPPAAGRHD
ncbi:GFA family protein [Gemmobacter fulvus]|uniref:GFA family protein n=1 Tax=Gemmobacter fulvus TaxID=2840474 RepID=UPI0027964E3C|nr:GFA family protein [Gemmobacter fulvus]MDQ1849950.1 GFA family protein [Gemmobacter fulvus]